MRITKRVPVGRPRHEFGGITTSCAKHERITKRISAAQPEPARKRPHREPA